VGIFFTIITFGIGIICTWPIIFIGFICLILGIILPSWKYIDKYDKKSEFQKSRYCPNCGREIDFNANFCPYCGKEFKGY
jgi:hypothetical protein